MPADTKHQKGPGKVRRLHLELGDKLPLFTEQLPRRVLLGNPHSYARIPIRCQGVWWRHVCSASRREEFFSETEHILIRCGEKQEKPGPRRRSVLAEGKH